jgi:hypothetical protein
LKAYEGLADALERADANAIVLWAFRPATSLLAQNIGFVARNEPPWSRRNNPPYRDHSYALLPVRDTSVAVLSRVPAPDPAADLSTKAMTSVLGVIGIAHHQQRGPPTSAIDHCLRKRT